MAGAALLTVLVPLAAAVIAWAAPRAAASVGLATAAGVVLAVAVVTAEVATEGPLDLVAGGWPQGLGIRIWVDGVSVVFLLASALVGLAATVHARDYFARYSGFWPLWLLLWAELNGVFITGD
ncbi:MAG: oxidoreductase, partial [Thiohalorhabdaceae bacterium]